MKKINKKWLITIGCVLLAAVAAVVVLLVVGKEQPKAEKEPEYKIYWNVEREYYKSGKYSHQQVGDDLYRVLLTTDGEQYQVEIRGYELVQKLDTLEIVGLLFDEEGIAIDVADVDSCTGGYAAKQYYVESVDGNKVVVNNNPYFTGYSKTLYLNDQTGIYDVSDSGPLCGYSTQLAYNDEIFAVEDKQGNVTHVFTKPYLYPDKVYWNVDKPYDSVNKLSTRQPNAYMEYEMDFILNGERVTYICKDMNVVNKIDGSRVCGLVLDENNQIVDYIPVKTATNGGRLGATNYYVTNLNYQNGKYLFRKTSTNSPLSSFLSFYPSQDMKIYDMTGNEGDIGMPTDVRIDDRTICVLDNRTMISMIYVVARGVDSPLYWNVDRDWNKTTQSTNRRPDSAGWYYFTMAAEGKQIKVKTQSLEFANAIDKAINVGLKLNGDVVERVYASSSVYPAGLYGSYYKITDITADGVITSEKTSDGKTTVKTAKVAEDCRYYNVSSTAAVEGEEISFADLYVGDTIHAYKNFNGEIQIVLVVTSYSNSPIYWNVNKTEYWDSKNEVSTRVKGADGYYHIRLAVNGKQVTLRTADKKMVDNIDGRTCMGLAVNGSIITKVYGATQTRNTKGGLFASSWYVTGLNGKVLTASSSKETDKRTMAADCQVYNVSKHAALVGEKSTVQVGDQIRCLLNENKQISVIFILNKANHKNQHNCNHCNKNVTWKPWDGTSTMADGGHYVLTGNSTMTKGVSVKEGQTVTLCLNGYALTKEKSRIFGTVKGTLNLIDCVGTGHVHGQTDNNASIALVDGGTLNIYGGTYTANAVTKDKNGGMFVIIGGGKINMYNGTITGGKTGGYGGNINVSNGIFTMHKGEISNGTSGEGQYGGNIALSGEKAVLIVKGGTISGGFSGSYGGNIAVAKSGAQLIISGGNISGGMATTHGGNISVALGTMSMTGGSACGGLAQTYGANISAVNNAEVTLVDAELIGGQVMLRNSGGITLGGKLIISDLYLNNHIFTLSAENPLQDAQIGISANKQGVIAENVSTDVAGQFVATNPEETVIWKDQQLILRSSEFHLHCHCSGFGDADHVCDETIEWIPVTDKMVMEDGGYYYLQKDMNTQLGLAENATVHLCLNGHTLQNPDENTVRVFKDIQAGQTLNIHDCGETGKIHGRVDNNAPVAMVKGTLNIYGGTITAEAVTVENKNGGILMAMNDGVINFYDGTITGGNTTGMGGCVYITHNAAFHMYGGTITDGTSATYGNTFAVAGNAVLTVLGGNIGMGSNEDCVYHSSSKPIVVGGDAQVAKIYLEGAAVLTTSETVPLQNALIGVEKATDGVLVQNILSEQLTCITNLGKGQMVWADGVLSLKMPHSHCVCVSADAVPEDHVCEDLIWQAISGSTTITADGNFFLDFSAKAAAITVADGVHAKLCLNGAKIYAMSTITLGAGSTLDICDCSTEKTGIIGLSGNATRGPVVLDKASTLNLWSGTITGKMNGNQKQTVVISHKDAQFHMYGGVINDGVDGNVTMSGGCFYQYGGSIVDGHSTGNGGNVLMSGTAVFYQYGGTISGGSADKKGGNVAMINANNRFYQYGGSIAGGTAGTYGGNVSLNNGAQFEMNGANALIADGVSTGATQGGGNVHIHKNIGKFTLINGVITGGTATGKGGSVYVESGKLDVQGGSITGGAAGVQGNCVYVTVSGDIEVAEGATVEDIHP
ncbi:MAG: hypothetical protein IKW10_01215 [Oscillospiraceae bacterium]|nr:hypothetical protein [Oscillospiraceae bacterium]